MVLILNFKGQVMRITSKGQVTIPRDIREFLGITPASEIDFEREKGRVYLVKSSQKKAKNKFHKFRGVATIQMSTDQIMQLTRS